jgi:hypothetical protein
VELANDAYSGVVRSASPITDAPSGTRADAAIATALRHTGDR